MLTEIIHVSYETKPIYTGREQYTKFLKWQKVISSTLYSNGSGLRIRKTLVVRERAVG